MGMIKQQICWVLFLLMILLAAPPQGYAVGDNFQCKGGIASPGDKKFEVLTKCGEPTSREARTEQRMSPIEGDIKTGPYYVGVTVEIEEWVYDYGSTQLVRFLTFENGILLSVETKAYGH